MTKQILLYSKIGRDIIQPDGVEKNPVYFLNIYLRNGIFFSLIFKQHKVSWGQFTHNNREMKRDFIIAYNLLSI
jgi:hypothetical protein